MEDYSFITSQFVYSFSRINSFYSGCKLSWFKTYIELEERCSSYDTEFGSFCHQILEMFYKGELDQYELAPYYEKYYKDKVTTPCPYPNGDTKYAKALEYFQNFTFDFDKYEILGVEKEIRYKLKDEYELVGYIDLLYREKETGKIILQDHKSSQFKILKNGNVSKSDQEHFTAFKRQQYLYSYAILKEYGRVDRLEWNMFNQQIILPIDWSEEEMNEAIDWAYDTIKKIETETEYPADPNWYFCSNLCNSRLSGCPYKRLGMIYDGIYAKCYNEKNKDFFEYGGMGIGMCEDWKNNKQEFFKWALESGYDEDMILKRYDEEADYDFFNCYWEPRPAYEEYGGM